MLSIGEHFYRVSETRRVEFKWETASALARPWRTVQWSKCSAGRQLLLFALPPTVWYLTGLRTRRLRDIWQLLRKGGHPVRGVWCWWVKKHHYCNCIVLRCCCAFSRFILLTFRPACFSTMESSSAVVGTYSARTSDISCVFFLWRASSCLVEPVVTKEELGTAAFQRVCELGLIIHELCFRVWWNRLVCSSLSALPNTQPHN